ncbi:uncharacterized protein LOC113312004 [Papaver somniferum]|uniref:uncharacterized protein LOC113312004 n=1 Tax=Papaver somniferum TaxID=3469 RepID=UPI000E6F6CB1|nr:uncharacterized protein LOC113312004 [Papaver somniferum]
MKVSDLLLDGEWVIPVEMLEMIETRELPVADYQQDRRIWSDTLTGEFSVASAVENIRRKYPKLKWTNQVWNSSIHLAISSNVWKLMINICSTNDNMKRRKFSMASRCPFCKNCEEDLEHILWTCNYSELIWKWLGDMFCFKNQKYFDDIFNFAKIKSPVVKEIWRTAAFITAKDLWFLRNKCVYEDASFFGENLKMRILKFTTECDVRMKALMWNSTYDLQILKKFGLKCRRSKVPRVQEIFFHLPSNNQILLCCDGASKGNPGISRYGFIGRNEAGECIVAQAGGLGITTNFYAEVMAVLCAGEWAIRNDHLEVIFISDSKTVITAFMTASLEKKGASLSRGEIIYFTHRPPFLQSIEIEDQPYYRFN